MKLLQMESELSEQFVDTFISSRDLWSRLTEYPFFSIKENRGLAESLFSALGVHSIEHIYLFDLDYMRLLGERSDLSGYFLQNCGTPTLETEFEFNDFIPGYKAVIKCWSSCGFYLVLVEDFTGVYLYAVGESYLTITNKYEDERPTKLTTSQIQDTLESSQVLLNYLLELQCSGVHIYEDTGEPLEVVIDSTRGDIEYLSRQLKYEYS